MCYFEIPLPSHALVFATRRHAVSTLLYEKSAIRKDVDSDAASEPSDSEEDEADEAAPEPEAEIEDSSAPVVRDNDDDELASLLNKPSQAELDAAPKDAHQRPESS